jgi:small GTP-binding protein
MFHSTDAKVIFVGEPSVGKTSIIQQYSVNLFDPESEATIGASYVSKLIETPTGSVQVNIWDTAGQERYRSLIPMYSRNAAAAVLVIDVTNPLSFEKMENWIGIVTANSAPGCAIYVCANKIDLEAVISLQQVEEFCQRRGFPFFRTSAKDLKSVSAVFERIGQDLIKAKTRPVVQVGPIASTEKKGCC